MNFMGVSTFPHSPPDLLLPLYHILKSKILETMGFEQTRNLGASRANKEKVHQPWS